MTLPRPVRAVCFDLDMTLVETRSDIAASANHVRTRFGLDPLPEAEVVATIGDGIINVLERTLGSPIMGREDEALAVFREHYEVHCLDRAYVYPGMRELLETLEAARIPRAVVSNKMEAFCRIILEGTDLARFFPVVIGGDTTGALKPDPTPLRVGLEQLAVDPAGAVMVGDSWRDVRAAHAMGCGSIAVGYGLGSPERLGAEEPHALVDDVAGIRAALGMPEMDPKPSSRPVTPLDPASSSGPGIPPGPGILPGPVHTAIHELLDGAGVRFRELEHEPTRTSEDSARVRGEPLRIGGKAILFKVDGEFHLFVMSAERRLRSARVRKHLGVRRTRFATAEELAELTGLVPGCVPPFGPPILPFPIHADPSVLANERIAFNSGTLTRSIIMTTKDWQELARPHVFPFTD